MSTESAQWAVELLDAVRGLPAKLPPPTLLEVAGYAHLENVASNIMAFFLNPGEQHGLGPLFLDALFATLGIAGSTAAAKVEREVATRKRNRIDLVVETPSYLIGIENKVYAGLSNPLDDYAAFLRERASQSNKTLVLALLACREGDDPGHEFKRISHGHLVREARAKLREQLRDGRFPILMEDFLDTMANLDGGTLMDPRWMQLFADRRQDLTVLLRHTTRFKAKLRERVDDLATAARLDGYANVVQWKWCEDDDLYDILVNDVTCSDGLHVAVDAVASPTGWTLEMVVMDNFSKRNTLPAELPRLQERLTTLRIKFEVTPTKTDASAKGENRCILAVRFGLDHDPKAVAKHLNDVIVQLATWEPANAKQQ
jgi:hypothetical protein